MSFMPNTSLAIQLEPAERAQLEIWGSGQGTPQQVALRCRIILGALAGQDNVLIAEQLGVSRPSAPESVFDRRGGSPLQVYALRPVTDCNCVAARRGGEQQEVNDPSVG